VRRRAILVLPKGQRPHPRRPYRGRMIQAKQRRCSKELNVPASDWGRPVGCRAAFAVRVWRCWRYRRLEVDFKQSSLNGAAHWRPERALLTRDAADSSTHERGPTIGCGYWCDDKQRRHLLGLDLYLHACL